MPRIFEFQGWGTCTKEFFKQKREGKHSLITTKMREIYMYIQSNEKLF